MYHTSRLHGRIHWQAPCRQSQGSGAHPYGVHLESLIVGDAWSAPAPHEARIMLGAGAGTSRNRFSGKPICAVPSKTDVLPHLTLDLPEVLAKLGAVLGKPRGSRTLEEEFGVDLGGQQRRRNTPTLSSAADHEGEGSSNWATMPTCTAFHAPVTGALELSLRRTGKRSGWT